MIYRYRFLKIATFMLLASFLGNTVNADTPNWKLYVVFTENDVGGHNRQKGSYELVWIRDDESKTAVVKKMKDAKRASLEGTKSKFTTGVASTSSKGFAVIFEYTHTVDRRAGSGTLDVKSMKLKKGKHVGEIKAHWNASSDTEKYLKSSIIRIIDLKAAKVFLNNSANTLNPYLGPIPTPLKKTPCEADLFSKACQEHTRKLKPIAIGVRG